MRKARNLDVVAAVVSVVFYCVEMCHVVSCRVLRCCIVLCCVCFLRFLSFAVLHEAVLLGFALFCIFVKLCCVPVSAGKHFCINTPQKA